MVSNKQELADLREYLKSLPRLADKDKEKRKQKALKDFWFFITTYFSHHIEGAKKESSVFRSYIHNNISSLTKTGGKFCFFAYRGSAKTTTISRLYVLWQIAKNNTRFTALISDTIDVAKTNLEFIKLEIEENSTYRFDFDIKQGATWTSDDITISKEKKLIKVKAYGSGKKIRGANFLGFRPDLIILDDIENDENVESKAQRDKLYNWFTKAILKLPDRKKPHTLIVVGTILHYDSVLIRISKRKDFFTKSFPLVINFPNSMEAWGFLYKENIIEAKKRYKAKEQYYSKSVILDDTQVSLFSLMFEYFEDIDSFNSELQNNPISKDRLIFNNYESYELEPKKCDAYYIGVDPSLGKSKKSDFFAIGYLGYLKKTNKFYAKFSGHKIPAYQMIHKIVSMYIELSSKAPTKVAIEVVAFQDFYKDIVKLYSKQNYGLNLPVTEIKQHSSKELRIESIAPLINDHTILINQNSYLLIEELKTYPKSPHDDLLDAVEIAYRCKEKMHLHDFKATRRVLKEHQSKFLALKGKYV